VKITETSNDSLGPWTKSVQYIDSLDLDGSILAQTTRVWNGTDWLDQTTEKFIYNINNQVLEKIKLLWNGTEYIPQIKSERSYDISGNVLQEVNYQYYSNSWVPSTKREYLYDQTLSRTTITSFTFITGAWIQSEQHILNYNTNQTLSSEIRSSSNGLSWDTVSLKTYSYSNLSGDLLHDSTFYYTSSGFLLQQIVHYFYVSPSKMNKTIRQEYYSFIYSDNDTSYIESELYFEYTLDIVRNATGQIIEEHGAQTRGSSQAWAFEHRYYGFNQAGEIDFVYNHEGTNLSTSINRQKLYSYPLLNMTYTSTGTSCIGCNNGKVNVSAIGGVAPYTISINSNLGSVTGMSIIYLPPGNYNFCLADDIGNEICHDVTILEYLNGIDKNSLEDSFNFTTISGSSDVMINNHYHSPVHFNLFDTSGKTIFTKAIAPGIFRLHVNEVSGGYYFYSALSAGFAKSGKLILIK